MAPACRGDAHFVAKILHRLWTGSVQRPISSAGRRFGRPPATQADSPPRQRGGSRVGYGSLKVARMMAVAAGKIRRDAWLTCFRPRAYKPASRRGDLVWLFIDIVGMEGMCRRRRQEGVVACMFCKENACVDALSFARRCEASS